MTPEEINELRTAAWMHDVGKITTPEYVVDKACKLETIFDRIELVRTRFELAQREVELDSLRRQVDLLKSGRIEDERITKIEQETVNKTKAIQADFDFLELCNKGGEFMADEKIDRLKEIASGTVKLRGDTMPLLTEDEVYNMSIRKGTLTSEEMNIMRNHAAVSIKMLSQLPFSRKLRKVPGYAGGHHECLNGKGYPQGLTADSLPLQARIMAIADIFEALTAHDRPYKRAMPLSVALKILRNMVEEGNLDADIVGLCLKEGVLLDYARRELNPEQIDLN